MNSAPAIHNKEYKNFSSKSSLRQFVIKKIFKSSLIFGILVGLYSYSKAYSFVKAYPTNIARQKLAETLGSNVGIEALLGKAHNVASLSGFVAWNFLCLVAAGGAIWGMISATKLFRGEEEDGRLELFLSGRTTLLRATINILLSFAVGLVVIFFCIAGFFGLIGRLHGADFTSQSIFFFALALIMGIIEFVAIGALLSQIMPTRSRALGLSAVIFGIFYLIRLTADTTNAAWLLNLSPLGWIEKLQPMYNSQPIWLIPIGLFALLLIAMTLVATRYRDPGEGIVKDHDTSRIHKMMLTSPIRAAIRLTKSSILGWLLSLIFAAFFYSLLAKGAAQSLDKSSAIDSHIHKISNVSSNIDSLSARSFMGITFLILMVILVFYVASALGKVREDEAKGYVDNFLTRPVGRIRWLNGRLLIILGVVIVGGIASGLASWVGQATQHTGLSVNTLLLSGINIIAPTICLLGAGVIAYSFIPRLTNFITYGLIGWSFLLVMLSSGLNLNHWLLDTSIMHQVSLSPAVNISWATNIVMIAIGLVLYVIGLMRFNSRDLQNE